MKKVVLIAAVVLMSVGVYSCEKDSSVEDTQALYENLDLDATDDDKKILEGIVQFGNTDVKQVMKARVDVIAFSYDQTFKELIPLILESGYSRIPIYENSFDNVKGILYIKDLLPH